MVGTVVLPPRQATVRTIQYRDGTTAFSYPPRLTHARTICWVCPPQLLRTEPRYLTLGDLPIRIYSVIHPISGNPAPELLDTGIFSFPENG
jgi:hypothetical protein